MTKSFKHHELTRMALRLGRAHRSKRFQRYNEISHALQPYPHRLGAWRPIALAPKITAQTGDQTDYLAQAGRLLRRRATLDHDIGGLPLLTLEEITSQLISGHARSNIRVNSTRQAMIMYSARHGRNDANRFGKRSTN